MQVRVLPVALIRMVGRVVMLWSRKPSEPPGLRGCNPYTIRQLPNRERKEPMKPVIRYQSQLLPRRSYKINRRIRIRPTQRLNLVFRPARAGPRVKDYELRPWSR